MNQSHLSNSVPHPLLLKSQSHLSNSVPASDAEEPVLTSSALAAVMSGQPRPPKRGTVQQHALDMQMQTLEAINQLVQVQRDLLEIKRVKLLMKGVWKDERA